MRPQRRKPALPSVDLGRLSALLPQPAGFSALSADGLKQLPSTPATLQATRFSSAVQWVAFGAPPMLEQLGQRLATRTPRWPWAPSPLRLHAPRHRVLAQFTRAQGSKPRLASTSTTARACWYQRTTGKLGSKPAL